jgi:hypothetical protein
MSAESPVGNAARWAPCTETGLKSARYLQTRPRQTYTLDSDANSVDDAQLSS